MKWKRENLELYSGFMIPFIFDLREFLESLENAT